jgi:hypothetical protein
MERRRPKIRMPRLRRMAIMMLICKPEIANRCALPVLEKA